MKCYVTFCFILMTHLVFAQLGDIDILSGTTPRINFNSAGMFQLSAEGNTFTLRQNLTYKFGYYNPDEFGPTSNNVMTLGSSSYRWAEAWVVNPLNTASDQRLKTNINSIKYGLDAIKQLEPVQYQWKKGHQRVMMGLLAQDVEKVIPEIVTHTVMTPDDVAKAAASNRPVDPNMMDSYSLSYSELIPILIKAMQELSEENEALKKRVEQLEQE